MPRSWQEMPAPGPMRPASDATTAENRAWPCSKILALTSRRELNSAMRARSWPDPAVQSASLNVEINVMGLRELDEGDRYRRESGDLLREARTLVDEVDKTVRGRIAG